MQFHPTEEQKSIQELAAKFSHHELQPIARSIETVADRPVFLEKLKKLAELGFMGLNVKSDYGGTEAGVIAFSVALTEIAKGCASTAVAMSVNNLVAEVLQAIGTENQKRKYIPPICDGTFSAGAFCLSESEAGSDPSRLRTRAEKVTGGWRITGTKMWISNAAYAGVFIVWALTDNKKPYGKGITCFIVDSDNPGVEIGKEEQKLGQKASSTNSVIFTECFVDDDAILGQVNNGFKIALGELTGGRIGIASLALGIGTAALDYAAKYTSQREQFGKKISEFQGPQFLLADSHTEKEAARLLTLHAAWLKETGNDYSKEASMAKLYSSEWSNRACYIALQLLGGIGYTTDSPIEKYSRDARVTTIYEGTSEIQRVIIAREILKDLT